MASPSIQSSAQQYHRIFVDGCVNLPVFGSQLITFTGINVTFFATPFVLPPNTDAIVAQVEGQQCQTSPDPNSPTTPCLPAFENNVRNLIMAGVTYVAAANNQNNGNCATSPARMGYGNPAYDFHVITVGGTTEQDQRWVRLIPSEIIPGCIAPDYCGDTGSNFGICVDIYAPAHNFGHLANISAFNAYRSQTTRIDQLSGTSFAAPVVSGIVARILERNPTWTPQQVWTYIRDQANHPACFDTTVSPCNDRLAYISPYD